MEGDPHVSNPPQKSEDVYSSKSVFRTCRRMRSDCKLISWQRVPLMWLQRFMQPESHPTPPAPLLFAHLRGWRCLVVYKTVYKAAGFAANYCLQSAALSLFQGLAVVRQCPFSAWLPSHNISSRFCRCAWNILRLFLRCTRMYIPEEEF